MAIAALVQSRRAIGQADESMRQNQRHVELSVRPFLTGHYITLSDRLLAIDIQNSGLGPAIITNWEVWSETNPNDVLSTAHGSYMDQFLAPKLSNPKLPFVFSTKKRGSYLPAGDTWRLFELDTRSIQDQRMLQAVTHDVKQISVHVDYESLYGEKFSEQVSYIKKPQRCSV